MRADNRLLKNAGKGYIWWNYDYMKIDPESSGTILRFAERLISDGHYEIGDINPDFAKQFDMSLKDVREICDQFEHDGQLEWVEMFTEQLDEKGKMVGEFSYDSLMVKRDAVKDLIEKLKAYTDHVKQLSVQDPIAAQIDRALKSDVPTADTHSGTITQNIIRIQTPGGLLIIDPRCGSMSLDGIGEPMNPRCKHFVCLLKLATSDGYVATYQSLIGKEPTKDRIRNLNFTIRNIKYALGILPEENARNRDIIENIKSHGYKLLVNP